MSTPPFLPSIQPLHTPPHEIHLPEFQIIPVSIDQQKVFKLVFLWMRIPGLSMSALDEGDHPQVLEKVRRFTFKQVTGRRNSSYVENDKMLTFHVECRKSSYSGTRPYLSHTRPLTSEIPLVFSHRAVIKTSVHLPAC